MVSKLILDQLQEINLIVIELINKYHGINIDVFDKYWYEVVINSDGSLRLGFQVDVMDNSIKHIRCENMKDFESIKDLLRMRL